ncbi:MAG: hypothetical protein ACXIVQ_09650 [Acidimicrobiales bacterium]
MPSPLSLLRRTLLIASVALLAVGVVGPLAAAQEDAPDQPSAPLTWGISPAAPEGRDTRSLITHVVEPGSTITDHVIVDNFGESPLTLDLYAADARPADGGFDVAASDEDAEAIGAWTTMGATRVEIPGRDSALVEVTMVVPDTAEPGDYAGGILASRRTAGTGDDVGLETERRVGTRVYLRVAGPIDPAMSIVGLRSGYDHRVNPVGRGHVQVTYSVVNTGNIRLSGTSEVQVSGPFGVGRRTLDGPAVEDLLPGHSVEHSLVVDGVAPLGRLHVQARVIPTESAGQPLDGAVPPAEATTGVWAPPWTAGAIVAIAGLVAVLWLWRRRRGGADPSGSASTATVEGDTLVPTA